LKTIIFSAPSGYREAALSFWPVSIVVFPAAFSFINAGSDPGCHSAPGGKLARCAAGMWGHWPPAVGVRYVVLPPSSNQSLHNMRFQKWSKVKLLMFNAAQHAMQLLALGGQGMEILGIKNCMQKRNL